MSNQWWSMGYPNSDKHPKEFLTRSSWYWAGMRGSFSSFAPGPAFPMAPEAPYLPENWVCSWLRHPNIWHEAPKLEVSIGNSPSGSSFTGASLKKMILLLFKQNLIGLFLYYIYIYIWAYIGTHFQPETPKMCASTLSFALGFKAIISASSSSSSSSKISFSGAWLVLVWWLVRQKKLIVVEMKIWKSDMGILVSNKYIRI